MLSRLYTADDRWEEIDPDDFESESVSVADLQREARLRGVRLESSGWESEEVDWRETVASKLRKFSRLSEATVDHDDERDSDMDEESDLSGKEGAARSRGGERKTGGLVSEKESDDSTDMKQAFMALIDANQKNAEHIEVLRKSVDELRREIRAGKKKRKGGLGVTGEDSEGDDASDDGSDSDSGDEGDGAPKRKLPGERSLMGGDKRLKIVGGMRQLKEERQLMAVTQGLMVDPRRPYGAAFNERLNKSALLEKNMRELELEIATRERKGKDCTQRRARQESKLSEWVALSDEIQFVQRCMYEAEAGHGELASELWDMMHEQQWGSHETVGMEKLVRKAKKRASEKGLMRQHQAVGMHLRDCEVRDAQLSIRGVAEE